MFVIGRPNLWMVIAAFVFGLIGGILLDRVVGGPGGLTLGLFVILIPGTLALVGPLAQEYWGQRYSIQARNRELFHDHATLLLNRVFWAASNADLSFDVLNFRFQATGQYNVTALTDGGRVPIESLLQWSNARLHLLAEPAIAPLLVDIERRVQQGRTKKQALDDLTEAKLGAALRRELGYDLVRADETSGWAEWPPQAQWYPGYLVSQLRWDNQIGSVTVAQTAMNHSNGQPATPLEQLSVNGQLAVQVVRPLTVDPVKFSSAYGSVRGDQDLRADVRAALTFRDADEAAVREFADAVRDFAESVEISEKHLVGVCPGCEHLLPR